MGVVEYTFQDLPGCGKYYAGCITYDRQTNVITYMESLVKPEKMILKSNFLHYGRVLFVISLRAKYTASVMGGLWLPSIYLEECAVAELSS